MKKIKKLILNKEIISNLTPQEANQIRGGVSETGRCVSDPMCITVLESHCEIMCPIPGTNNAPCDTNHAGCEGYGNTNNTCLIKGCVTNVPYVC